MAIKKVKKKRMINKIIIISSIIFIIIMSYFFIMPLGQIQVQVDENGTIVPQGTLIEQLFIPPTNTYAAAVAFHKSAKLYLFFLRLSEQKDLAKYGAWVNNAERIKHTSNSRSTCLYRTHSSRRPCTWYTYRCPSTYMGLSKMGSSPNSDHKCLYIKYPLNIIWSA